MGVAGAALIIVANSFVEWLEQRGVGKGTGHAD